MLTFTSRNVFLDFQKSWNNYLPEFLTAYHDYLLCHVKSLLSIIIVSNHIET